MHHRKSFFMGIILDYVTHYSAATRIELNLEYAYMYYYIIINLIVHKLLRIRNKTTVIIRNSENKTKNGLITQDEIMEIK